MTPEQQQAAVQYAEAMAQAAAAKKLMVPVLTVSDKSRQMARPHTGAYRSAQWGRN